MTNPNHNRPGASNDTDPSARSKSPWARKLMAGTALIGAGFAAGLGVGNSHETSAVAPDTSVSAEASVPAETPAVPETLSPEEERAQVEREAKQAANELTFAVLAIADSPKSHADPLDAHFGSLTNRGSVPRYGTASTGHESGIPAYEMYVVEDQLMVSAYDTTTGYNPKDAKGKPRQNDDGSLKYYPSTSVTVFYDLSADGLRILQDGSVHSTDEVRALIARDDTKVGSVMVYYEYDGTTPSYSGEGGGQSQAYYTSSPEYESMGDRDHLDSILALQPNIIARFDKLEAMAK